MLLLRNKKTIFLVRTLNKRPVICRDEAILNTVILKKKNGNFGRNHWPHFERFQHIFFYLF